MRRVKAKKEEPDSSLRPLCSTSVIISQSDGQGLVSPKEKPKAWRKSAAVKSTDRSFRGSGFDSSTQHGSLELFKVFWRPPLDSLDTACLQYITCRQNSHTHIK